MARYIDSDALIEDIQETVCGKCGDISDGIKCKSCGIDDTLGFLENAPTADVVPKSEVDKWKNAAKIANKEREKLSNHYFIDTQIGNGTPLQRAKRELASEIFEEIEKILNEKFLINHGVVLISKEDFAELKNKYTEDGK